MHVHYFHLTFSKVAIRSMASVTRCSTVRDMRRKTMTARRWRKTLVSCVQNSLVDVGVIVDYTSVKIIFTLIYIETALCSQRGTIFCCLRFPLSFMSFKIVWRFLKNSELSVCLSRKLSAFIILHSDNLCSFIKPQSCQTVRGISLYLQSLSSLWRKHQSKRALWPL